MAGRTDFYILFKAGLDRTGISSLVDGWTLRTELGYIIVDRPMSQVESGYPPDFHH